MEEGSKLVTNSEAIVFCYSADILHDRDEQKDRMYNELVNTINAAIKGFRLWNITLICEIGENDKENASLYELPTKDISRKLHRIYLSRDSKCASINNMLFNRYDDLKQRLPKPTKPNRQIATDNNRTAVNMSITENTSAQKDEPFFRLNSDTSHCSGYDSLPFSYERTESNNGSVHSDDPLLQVYC